MDRKRRAPRVTLAARVEGLAQYRADVRVVDLSPSGALLESPRFLERNSLLTLQFSLGGHLLSAPARVVHCSEAEGQQFRAGVRFEALTEEELHRILEFLRASGLRERRGEPRVFVDEAARLDEEVDLRVLNLSLLGGLFSGRHPLEFESEHDFVFTLPQGDVHARGIVRHCAAWMPAHDAAVFRLGVEFTGLLGDDRERVVAYLEEQIQAS